MKISICLPTDPDRARFERNVQAVEEHGFHSLWLTDLGLDAIDVFVGLTLAARCTRRIRLAAGVHPPQFRGPAQTLNALVSLDRVSEGRCSIGIGTGSPPFLQPVGDRPYRMKEMRALIPALRALMRGETVSADPPGLRLRGARLAVTPEQPLPIYVAATGPKMLSLAGELADGAFAHVGAAVETVADSLGRCRDAAPAGSDRFDFNPFLYAVLGMAPEEARARAGFGARQVAYRAPHLARLAGCTDEQVSRLRAGRGEDDDIFTESLVDRLTLCGSARATVERLERLAALGVRHVTLSVRSTTVETSIERLGREVVARFD